MLELLPAVALGLTAVGYGLRRVALALAGALGWLASGVYAYTQSTSLWDSYYIAFWLFIGAGITIIVDAFYLLIQEQSENNREERQAEFDEKRDEREETAKDRAESSSEHPIDTMRRKHGLGPSEARARRKENRRFGVWR